MKRSKVYSSSGTSCVISTQWVIVKSCFTQGPGREPFLANLFTEQGRSLGSSPFALSQALKAAPAFPVLSSTVGILKQGKNYETLFEFSFFFFINNVLFYAHLTYNCPAVCLLGENWCSASKELQLTVPLLGVSVSCSLDSTLNPGLFLSNGTVRTRIITSQKEIKSYKWF